MVKQPEAEFSWWPSFSHPPRGLQEGSISVPLRGRETTAQQWILGSTACSPWFLWHRLETCELVELCQLSEVLLTVCRQGRKRREPFLSLISFHKRSVSRQKNSAHLWRCLLREVGVVVQVANCSQESGWGIVKIPRGQVTRPHNAHQPHLAMHFYLETYCGLFATNLYFMF